MKSHQLMEHSTMSAESPTYYTMYYLHQVTRTEAYRMIIQRQTKYGNSWTREQIRRVFNQPMAHFTFDLLDTTNGIRAIADRVAPLLSMDYDTIEQHLYVIRGEVHRNAQIQRKGEQQQELLQFHHDVKERPSLPHPINDLALAQQLFEIPEHQ
jgi:hypothetical protein